MTPSELALVHNEFPLTDGVPIVALGRLDDLAAFRLTIDAFDSTYVCDWEVGVGELAQQTGQPAPLGECAFNMSPRPDVTVVGPRWPMAGVATRTPVYQVFWSGLSDDVSVVAIEPIGGRSMHWQRPTGGVSVFVTPITGAGIEMVAYDTAGRELESRIYRLRVGQ